MLGTRANDGPSLSNASEGGSGESRIGVQATRRGEFGWATWATKTEEIEVKESRLTD